MRKQRKPGEVVLINCPACDGKGYTLIKHSDEVHEEDMGNSTPCKECNGTGKLEGTVIQRAI